MAETKEETHAKKLREKGKLRFYRRLLVDESRGLPRVTKPAVDGFFGAIDQVFQQDTEQNIQRCKQFIVTYIAKSKARLRALGNFLVILHKSIYVNPEHKDTKALRQRFDILLIIHDVLFDTGIAQSRELLAMCAETLYPYIHKIVVHYASFVTVTSSPEDRKLRALVNLWVNSRFFKRADRDSLQHQLDEASPAAQPKPFHRQYTLPKGYFGDVPSRKDPIQTKWQYLPAAYMVDSLVNYPRLPILTKDMSPKKFSGGLASDSVQSLLNEYLNNIDVKSTNNADTPKGESLVYEFATNDMGFKVMKDKKTEERRVLSTGYGWSEKLCQDMETLNVPYHVSKLRDENEDNLQFRTTRRNLNLDYEERQYLRRNEKRKEKAWQRNRHRSSGSYSRPGSRSSYDSYGDRPSSRGYERDRRRSSRDVGRGHYNSGNGRQINTNNTNTNDNNNNHNNHRLPIPGRNRPSRWNDTNTSNRHTASIPNEHRGRPANQPSFGQGFANMHQGQSFQQAPGQFPSTPPVPAQNVNPYHNPYHNPYNMGNQANMGNTVNMSNPANIQQAPGFNYDGAPDASAYGNGGGYGGHSGGFVGNRGSGGFGSHGSGYQGGNVGRGNHGNHGGYSGSYQGGNGGRGGRRRGHQHRGGHQGNSRGDPRRYQPY